MRTRIKWLKVMVLYVGLWRGIPQGFVLGVKFVQRKDLIGPEVWGKERVRRERPRGRRLLSSKDLSGSTS